MDLITQLTQDSEKWIASLDADPTARALGEGTLPKAMYERFLIKNHPHVDCTEQLCADAAARMVSLGQHPDLAELFARKAVEEFGHGDWIIADLQALGVPREPVVRAPPSGDSKGYTEWLKFVTTGDTPVALLGAAFTREYVAIRRAGEAARNMVRYSGIPNIENAVSFLSGHADADEEHVPQLTHALQQVVDPLEHELVLLTAAVTRATYGRLFSSLSEEWTVHPCSNT